MTSPATGPPAATFAQVVAFLRRRRLLILGVFGAGGLAVSAFVSRLPDVYEATTTIVVERPTLPEAYPGTLTLPKLEEKLRVASTLLTSDAFIQRVAADAGLLSEAFGPTEVARTLKGIRDGLDIRVSNLDSFQLAVRGEDPWLITRLANGLADRFIKETVGYSQRVVRGTSSALAGEKLGLDRRLQEAEARIRAFRERYPNLAPDQQDVYYRTLERLEARVEATARELRERTDRAEGLERDLAATPATIPSEAERPPAERPPEPVKSPLALRVETLEAALAAARARYTDGHPEIHRLQRELRDAVRRLADEPAPPPAPVVEPPRLVVHETPNPVHPALVAALERARADVRALEDERRRLAAELAAYSARARELPGRAQELAALTRDYDALRERHRTLSAKMLEADLAQKVDVQERAEKFRVLDVATVPVEPIRPRRLLILLVGGVMAAGVALGAGLVVDRVIDTSLHDARAAEAAFGLPVLATVPDLKPARRERP